MNTLHSSQVMLPQYVKQPIWYVALGFVRSIYTTDSTTTTAIGVNQGLQFF